MFALETGQKSAGLAKMAELSMGKDRCSNSAFLSLTTTHGLGERPEGGNMRWKIAVLSVCCIINSDITG